MYWILLAVMLPLTVHAQWTFGPVQLDGESDNLFSYPGVTRGGEDRLRCTWSTYSFERISAFGQLTAPDGTLIGPRIVYEDLPTGQYSCPSDASTAPLSGGGEARLFYHS